MYVRYGMVRPVLAQALGHEGESMSIRRSLAAVGVTALAAALVPLITATPASAAGPVTQVDFNDDGAPDLVIAAPNEAVNGRPAAGAVYVVFGDAPTATANKARPNVTPAPVRLTQNTPGTHAGAETGDRFGNSVETGDFNEDGIT